MAILLTFILYTGIGNFIAISYKYIANKVYSKKLLYIVFLCVLLGLFSALRGNAGTDTLAYRAIYFGEDTSFSRGPLYICFSNFFSVLGLPYEFLLFFVGFLTALFSFLAINMERKKIDPFVAGLVFFFDLYLYSFNVMRQMLAISICLLAVSFYLREEKKKGIMLFIIASLIHSPAIIYLAVIFFQFIFRKKYYKSIAVICIGVTLFFVLNRNALFVVMNYLIGNNSHYMHYFNSVYVGEMDIISYVLKLLPVIIFVVMSSPYFKIDKRMRIYSILLVIGYILGALDEFYGNEVGRIGYYFSYLRIFLLAYSACHKLKFGKFVIKQNWEKGTIICYILIVYIYNIYIAGGGNLVPYGLFEK